MRSEIKEREEAETEWRKAEEALLESEERFRDLYDHAPIGYHEYDEEGRIVSVNRTDVEMLGYSAEEMIGQPMWKFNTDEEMARRRVLAKLSGAQPPGQNIETAIHRKDGTIVTVLFQDRLVLDEKGRIKGIRCTIQDITERKQAEDRYRTILGDYHRGFLDCGCARSVFGSKRCLLSFDGHSRDELLNMRIPDVDDWKDRKRLPNASSR